MAVAIDTLAYARRLRDAGFSEEQAEGQASALAAAMTETLATKQDLRELAASVEARFVRVELLIAELEKRLDIKMDARLASLEHRITLRLGGITVAGFGVMTALLKLS